jgi:hypothetical protein
LAAQALFLFPIPMPLTQGYNLLLAHERPHLAKVQLLDRLEGVVAQPSGALEHLLNFFLRLRASDHCPPQDSGKHLGQFLSSRRGSRITGERSGKLPKQGLGFGLVHRAVVIRGSRPVDVAQNSIPITTARPIPSLFERASGDLVSSLMRFFVLFVGFVVDSLFLVP